MKFCMKCFSDKPETEFGIDNSRKDNLNPYCRECIRLRNAFRGGGEVCVYHHNGLRSRRGFDVNTRRRLDRVERSTRNVFVECEGKVWRWSNFIRPVALSFEEWLVKVIKRGQTVRYLA